MTRILAIVLGCWICASPADKLLVVSVDGLDQRYLDRRDESGLRIPNIRKLLRSGQTAKGVVGVVPTITWPSHTTIISGVTPAVHGIRSNRRPASEGGDYPWSAQLLKARTLLDAARTAGKRTATITWPVTVDAPVDFNLPEYFQRRRGGAMDMRSILSRAVPADLGDRIARKDPTFPQEWMDDRTRTIATVYLLQTQQPDLLLVHLVDLDSEAHDNGPFTREANAVLEYTDQLIGHMIAAMPRGYAIALVSDHGFEHIERVVNIRALSSQKGIAGMELTGGVLTARTADAASFVRQLASDSQYGIGRQIPQQELRRFAPDLASAAGVWEPAAGVQFTSAATPDVFTRPHEAGNHGHWPTRYRSVFILAGDGVRAESLSELQLTDIAGRLAEVIHLPFTPGPK